MMRSLYRFLLRLHPVEFRDEFTEEMLWIFDQAGQGASVIPLFVDALESLARQWLVRSGAWPYAVGVMVNGTLLMGFLVGPDLFGGARPKPAEIWQAPAPPPVHYRLYVWIEKPAWNDSQQATPRKP
jgi:hypothetical protein